MLRNFEALGLGDSGMIEVSHFLILFVAKTHLFVIGKTPPLSQ